MEKNNENDDIPFLCSMWGGDATTYSSGTGGFEKTARCMLLAIQPDPLMEELQHFMHESKW